MSEQPPRYRPAPPAREARRQHVCERCGVTYTQESAAVLNAVTQERGGDGWVPIYCPRCTRRSLSAAAHEAARRI
jgi:hypothetical protein